MANTEEDDCSLTSEGLQGLPTTPRKVNVRCSTVSSSGRLVHLVTTVQNLPQHCTVRQLQQLMYDHPHVAVSIRNPIELQHWGKTLELDKTLKYYAIKEHSEITVVIKAKIREGVPYASGSLHRVRLSSHNL